MSKMRIVCAWCKTIMQEGIATVKGGELTSHGICQKCLSEALEEIDIIDKPVTKQ